MARLELGAAGPGWSPWKRKGAKAVKKAEAGTNDFPFRNCSSDCYIFDCSRGVLFTKSSKVSVSTNIFQCPFLALCPALTIGLAG